MRKLFLNLFIVLLIFSSCKSPEDIKVISIGYHSDNCEDCNLLKKKMKRMNRKFLFSPIVFIKYDKTSVESKSAAEEKLKEFGVLETARRDDGLKYVILYDAKSKEKLDMIQYNDEIELIKDKIAKALER